MNLSSVVSEELGDLGLETLTMEERWSSLLRERLALVSSQIHPSYSTKHKESTTRRYKISQSKIYDFI